MTYVLKIGLEGRAIWRDENAVIALAPSTRAVVPPPDGGYPNQNTAEGDSALFSLTSGTDNTGSIDIESNKPPDELLTLARAPQRRRG